MSISAAAPVFEGTSLHRFAAAAHVTDKPLDMTRSAPVQKIEGRTRAANDNITRQIGAAFDQHARLVRQYGLADNRGQLSNLLNPGMDGLLLMSAMANPAFAPVASAIAMADAINYIKADRAQGKNKGKKKSALRADMPNAGIDWSKWGYHANKPANKNEAPDADSLSKADREMLSRDPAQNRDMQQLFAQKSQGDQVMASTQRRRQKGLALSRNTAEAVLTQDSSWLRRNIAAPLPGHL